MQKNDRDKTYFGLKVIGLVKDKDDIGWFVELILDVHHLSTSEAMALISKLPLTFYDFESEYELLVSELHVYRGQLTLKFYKI